MKVYVRIVGEKPLHVKEYNVYCGTELHRRLVENGVILSNYVIFYNGKQSKMLPSKFKDEDFIVLVKILSAEELKERFS